MAKREVTLFDVDAVEVHRRLRPVSEEAVERLKASMAKLGLHSPITVRYYEERPAHFPGDTVDAVVVGDLRWHGGDGDFAWIAEDNTLVPMDAQTMFAFGQAAMAHKQAMIFAARELKDRDEIPADFSDDDYWL